MNLLPDSIWLATDPVDMRTGVDGLSLHVQQALGRAPCDGTAYVFSNRRRIRLKVVSWDGTGVWMCLRRLHRGPVKRKVAEKPLQVYKQRIRELTRRSGGRSMSDVVQGLRSYMLGWKGHFQLAQTPKVWRRLDEWLRCRLRAIQLRNWKRGATMYRELPKLWGDAVGG